MPKGSLAKPDAHEIERRVLDRRKWAKELPDVVARPRRQFANMPHRWMWEATRRHPAYVFLYEEQVEWQDVWPHMVFLWAEFSSLISPGDLLEKVRRKLSDPTFTAVIRSDWLPGLGLRVEPLGETRITRLPSPAEEADGVSVELFPGWEGPAARPARLDVLAENLALGLSAPACRAFGSVLSDLGCKLQEADLVESREERATAAALLCAYVQAMRDLPVVTEEPWAEQFRRAFDFEADPTLVQLNPLASQKDVVAEVKNRLKDLQEKRGRGQTRFSEEKLAEQLAVWDKREGWTGAGYDHRRRESNWKTAKDLDIRQKLEFEQRLHTSSTVDDRYKAAFSLITGQKYTPKTWWNAFGRFAALLIRDPDERREYESEGAKWSERRSRTSKRSKNFTDLSRAGGFVEPTGAKRVRGPNDQELEPAHAAAAEEESSMDNLLREMVAAGETDASVVREIRERFEMELDEELIGEYREQFQKDEGEAGG